jgi:hypothetical protein
MTQRFPQRLWLFYKSDSELSNVNQLDRNRLTLFPHFGLQRRSVRHWWLPQIDCVAALTLMTAIL